jgi:hypothetical protein
MARRVARKQAQVKVYVSYQHDGDQRDRDRFGALFADRHDVVVLEGPPLEEDEEFDEDLKPDAVRQKIREEFLRDSAVTVVLVGASTWKRKHVDWEIGASVRHTQTHPRSGLLGILLPSYMTANKGRQEPHTMPPRLYDNVACKFAQVHEWSDDASEVKLWLDQAFEARSNVTSNNTRVAFPGDRNGKAWS